MIERGAKVHGCLFKRRQTHPTRALLSHSSILYSSTEAYNYRIHPLNHFQPSDREIYLHILPTHHTNPLTNTMPTISTVTERQLLRVNFDQDETLTRLWESASTTQSHRDAVTLWAYALTKFVLQAPLVIGASDSIVTPYEVGLDRIFLHAASSGSEKDVQDAEDEMFQTVRQRMADCPPSQGAWVLVACGSSAKLWNYGTKTLARGAATFQPVFSRSSSRADLPSYRDLQRHRLEWERIFDLLKKHKSPTVRFLCGANNGELGYTLVDEATQVTDLQVSGSGELSGRIMGAAPVERLPHTSWYRAVILDDDGEIRDCYQYTSNYIAGERFRYWAWSVPGYPDLSRPRE